jgi:hypothetical protein
VADAIDAVRKSVTALPLRLSEAELAMRRRRAESAGSDPTTRTTWSTEEVGSDRTRRTRTAISGKEGRSTLPAESSPASERMKAKASSECCGCKDVCAEMVNFALEEQRGAGTVR